MDQRNIALAAGLAALMLVTSARLGAQPPPPPAFAPSNLSEAGVRSMAAGCSICHGTDGRAAAGATVAGLAGMPRDQIMQAITQFRDGRKPATLMHQIAKGYNDAEIASIAEYFSKQQR